MIFIIIKQWNQFINKILPKLYSNQQNHQRITITRQLVKMDAIDIAQTQPKQGTCSILVQGYPQEKPQEQRNCLQNTIEKCEVETIRQPVQDLGVCDQSNQEKVQSIDHVVLLDQNIQILQNDYQHAINETEQTKGPLSSASLQIQTSLAQQKQLEGMKDRQKDKENSSTNENKSMKQRSSNQLSEQGTEKHQILLIQQNYKESEQAQKIMENQIQRPKENVYNQPQLPLQPLTLQLVKSQKQLKADFEENQKILASLSFNIDDLFKKISSLTEQVKNQISAVPIRSAKDVIEETQRKKIQSSAITSQNSLNNIKIQQLEEERKQFKNNLPILLNNIGIQPENLFRNPDPYPDDQLSMKMFQIGQSLGHGKFGQVLECLHRPTGHLFALKKIFKSTLSQYSMHNQILTQLQASKRMDHPNIIHTYTAFTDDFHIFVLCEYALGVQLVKKFGSPEDEVSRIIRQILEAVKYMHGKGVIHRDLKAQNVLLWGQVVKVCDFGWADVMNVNQQKQQAEKTQQQASINKQHTMDILCGTLDYISPEMVNSKSYTKQVDLWNVGILTYQLIFGIPPFRVQPNSSSSSTKSATFQRVKKLQYAFPGAYRFSKECIDFITKLLKPENQRMRIQQCLQHDFIKKYWMEDQQKLGKGQGDIWEIVRSVKRNQQQKDEPKEQQNCNQKMLRELEQLFQ